MAGRILNRRALRDQADQAEQSKVIASNPALAAVPVPKNSRTKPVAAPKVKKARVKKAPPRVRARWGVFDGAMKQIAIFDYNQQAAAHDKLADLLANKKGSHFLQIVKDPMPEPALASALSVP
jgi:hypothetical protein